MEISNSSLFGVRIACECVCSFVISVLAFLVHRHEVHPVRHRAFLRFVPPLLSLLSHT